MSTARQWQAGLAAERITPPMGSQMAGFDARKGVSTGVHDDLHARAMVLSDGDVTVAFVSVEVIAVSRPLAQRVREAVAVCTGIPAANIFLCATHTHCGPVTLHHFFNQGQSLDEQYLDSLVESIVSAIDHAARSLTPSVLRIGKGTCNIAVNRRTEDGLPIDPEAGIVAIESPEGTLRGIAVFYACHTTVLGPDTLSITQDFPYYTLEALRAKLGANVACMYFNGAEGDLSIGHKSDLSAVGIIDSFRTFETAKRLGETLANAVLEALPEAKPQPALLRVVAGDAELPLKQYRALEEMTAARVAAKAAMDAVTEGHEGLLRKQRSLFARIEEYYADLYEHEPRPDLTKLPAEMAVVQIGDAAIVTLPGEVFVRIALAIRSRSPFAQTIFAGLTNDYIGYVPDASAKPDAGYEVIASRVPAEAAIVMENYAVTLLRSVKGEQI